MHGTDDNRPEDPLAQGPGADITIIIATTARTEGAIAPSVFIALQAASRSRTPDDFQEQPKLAPEGASAEVRPWSLCCLEHRRTPFELDRQYRGHWSILGLGRRRRQRIIPLGRRGFAHE